MTLEEKKSLITSAKNKKEYDTKLKKQALSHTQSACDETSTLYKRIPIFGLNFFVV